MGRVVESVRWKLVEEQSEWRRKLWLLFCYHHYYYGQRRRKCAHQIRLVLVLLPYIFKHTPHVSSKHALEVTSSEPAQIRFQYRCVFGTRHYLFLTVLIPIWLCRQSVVRPVRLFIYCLRASCGSEIVCGLKARPHRKVVNIYYRYNRIIWEVKATNIRISLSTAAACRFQWACNFQLHNFKVAAVEVFHLILTPELYFSSFHRFFLLLLFSNKIWIHFIWFSYLFQLKQSNTSFLEKIYIQINGSSLARSCTQVPVLHVFICAKKIHWKWKSVRERNWKNAVFLAIPFGKHINFFFFIIIFALCPLRSGKWNAHTCVGASERNEQRTSGGNCQHPDHLFEWKLAAVFFVISLLPFCSIHRNCFDGVKYSWNYFSLFPFILYSFRFTKNHRSHSSHGRTQSHTDKGFESSRHVFPSFRIYILPSIKRKIWYRLCGSIPFTLHSPTNSETMDFSWKTQTANGTQRDVTMENSQYSLGLRFIDGFFFSIKFGTGFILNWFSSHWFNSHTPVLHCE